MIKQIKLVRNNSYSLYYSNKHLNINWHESCYILMRGDEYETENAIYSNIETNIKIKSKTIKILRFLD